MAGTGRKSRRITKTPRSGWIAGSQVTVVRLSHESNSPLFFVEMSIAGSLGAKEDVNARYDIGKAVFIDIFDDQETMYQLRRVELKLAEMINRTFRK